MHKLRTALTQQCAGCSRHASTSSTPFPFPTAARPTPHQIFHLPLGASQKDIKARYYELVRVHHPDSPSAQLLSPAERRSRFQAISSAYDSLRGKRGSASTHNFARDDVEMFREELERRKRAWARRQSPGPEFAYPHGPGARNQWTESTDDAWKDRVILIVGILALGAGIGPAFLWPSYTAGYQAHVDAARNLAQARKDAREFGEERRREIRKRVQEYEKRKTEEARPSDPKGHA
ncbi:uncharacterized protein BXZ73DRAFT_42063 [Epithele typhae]|uniref:uncharacterized protein n=1 Tax=Epithele typhae TaxID=378194 RepID=UPI0020073BAD|nr:uncharacterized protein BXZ73DRAFT_42063 [Epithele typhae]KAH9941290.1 hypothetical protein BXZ73DRAFT_42063 [Epithele typhae]